MNGWVRSYRSEWEHELFKPEPFTEREAWRWLYSNAAWEDTIHRVRGAAYKVPRGTLFTTIRGLMEQWKWGNTKTANFLKLLQKQDMIRVETKTGKTLVTICNYSKFQDTKDLSKTETRHRQDTGKTPARHRQDTKEETNNIITTTLLNGREADFYDALGENGNRRANGNFLTLSHPMNWIDNGCDIDLDILPTIQKLSQANKNITSWKYFSQAVFEAMNSRTAPRPEPMPFSQNRYAKKRTDADITRSMIEDLERSGQ